MEASEAVFTLGLSDAVSGWRYAFRCEKARFVSTPPSASEGSLMPIRTEKHFYRPRQF
jgi:hypothetical protein